MQVVKKINSLNQVLEKSRKRNKSVGFVPTMGYLHEGHDSLIMKSKKEVEE